MKIFKLTLIVLCALAAFSFLGPHIEDPAFIFPFCDGEIDLYTWAGVAVLAITIWGLHRLNRNNDQEE